MQTIQKAIVKKGEKILTILRSKDSWHYPLHWDLPGGLLEENEKPQKGIEREITEETGLKIKARAVLAVFEQINYGKNYRFVIYSTEEPKILDMKMSHEHADFKWVTLDELRRMKIEPFLQEFIRDHSDNPI